MSDYLLKQIKNLAFIIVIIISNSCLNNNDCNIHSYDRECRTICDIYAKYEQVIKYIEEDYNVQSCTKILKKQSNDRVNTIFDNQKFHELSSDTNVINCLIKVKRNNIENNTFLRQDNLMYELGNYAICFNNDLSEKTKQLSYDSMGGFFPKGFPKNEKFENAYYIRCTQIFKNEIVREILLIVKS